MLNRFDELLRTDARDHPCIGMRIGQYHIADALAADADAILKATKRVKTTAWVASYATVTNGADDTLTISAPAMMGAVPNGELKFVVATSTTNTLAVAAGSGDNADTITITVAETTATNNTAAKIQTALRALGTVNEIDVSAFGCVGSAGWDAGTLAKKNDTAVAMASGVTGTYDEYAVDYELPEPRTLIATAAGTAAHVAHVAVTAEGLDGDGQEIEEELPYFTADTASSNTATGSKAFAKVTKLKVPSHDGADATTAVGFTDVFGLPYRLGHKMLTVAFDGTWEASAPTVALSDELCLNTIDIVGTPDGKKDVDILMYL